MNSDLQKHSRIFITYEDRLQLLDGLKILCLSFSKYCPEEKLQVFLPEISEDLLKWSKYHTSSNISLLKSQIEHIGWNVKPQLLLNALDAGYTEVIWIDADILLTNVLSPDLYSLDENTVVVADSVGTSDDARAVFWLFKVRRRFERLLNTCFLRITSQHYPLLTKWQNLICHPAFQETQNLPMEERPSHLFGDQDLLEGLLMSEHFNSVPVEFLHHGQKMIHASSIYSIRERLSVIYRQWKCKDFPIIVHAHGLKPWMLIYRTPSSRNLTDVLVELSPYIPLARSYREFLDSDTSWMEPRTILGRISIFLSLGNSHLRGIPVILLLITWEKMKSFMPNFKFSPKQ